MVDYLISALVFIFIVAFLVFLIEVRIATATIRIGRPR